METFAGVTWVSLLGSLGWHSLGGIGFPRFQPVIARSQRLETLAAYATFFARIQIPDRGGSNFYFDTAACDDRLQRARTQCAAPIFIFSWAMSGTA